jgi:serine/threonine-protein kinase
MSPAPSSEFLALQQVVLGRYSLDREIGRGGMGVVFLARDVALDRPVAIKLLAPALAASAAGRERFLREARAAARLSHPHIVPVHAVEEHGPVVFFVMGYVDGETLGARVRRAGPLSSTEAMRVVQEVAWALAHAHANGVVHRDVKPDNILLERDGGRALVADFGIAQLADAGATTGGHAAGTPHYMSPEQAAGEPADARSDLYSLGVTAFFAATGGLPFDGRTAAALLAHHVATPAPALLTVRPSLPPRFAAAVDRCLAKDPAERPASAEQLAAAVREARGAAFEAPAPVRGFLREADQAGAEIGTALTASAASLVMAGIAQAAPPSLFDITGIVYTVAATLSAALAVVRSTQLLASARALLRRGHDHRAVAPALAAAERERDEELAAERTVAPRAARSEARERWVLGAAGAAKTVGAAWLVHADVPYALQLLGVAGSIAVPTATVRLVWRGWGPGRRLWSRLLGGAAGRLAFRVAGTGLPAQAALPSAGEPTMVALGRAADELFAALPDGQRERLGDVPALVARLQANAAVLRARADEPAAAERLQVVAAALEAVRIDLLKLHAGAGSLDELTRDIEAAREVGRHVDAALAGRAEVAALLRPRADATTPT